MQFPAVKPVLYDVDGQGYDVGPGELPQDLARPTGAQPIALASCTVRHGCVQVTSARIAPLPAYLGPS